MTIRFLKILSFALGFGLVFTLTACQTPMTPEQVTAAFWEAMANGDIETAKRYTMKGSQHLVSKQQNLLDSSSATGKVMIEGDSANVDTVLTLQEPEKDKLLKFDTVLSKVDQSWKVDYQKTLDNLLNQPFGRLFKSLNEIGEAINNEIEKGIPLFEKQLKAIGEQLIEQMEEFRRELEKELPPEKHKLPPGTI